MWFVVLLQDPIKQPLLKRLAGQEELSQKSIQIFLDILYVELFVYLYLPLIRAFLIITINIIKAVSSVVSYHCYYLDHVVPILKYMGDYPSKRARQATELTDAILEPALQHVSTL